MTWGWDGDRPSILGEIGRGGRILRDRKTVTLFPKCHRWRCFIDFPNATLFRMYGALVDVESFCLGGNWILIP